MRAVICRTWGEVEDLQGHSVFQIDTNEGECQVRLGCKAAARGRNVRVACPSQQPNRGIAQGCHHLGNVPTADLRTVFIEGHIPDPMRAVLNLPLPPHNSNNRSGVARSELRLVTP